MVAVFEPEQASHELITSLLVQLGYACVDLPVDLTRAALPVVAVVANTDAMTPSIKEHIEHVVGGFYIAPLLALGGDNGDELSVSRAFDFGCMDFIAKPLHPVDFVVRFNATRKRFQQLQSSRLERERLVHRLAERRRDLEEARRLQLEFSAPTYAQFREVELASFLSPSYAVGGDLFNYLDLDERYTAFYMLDVAGHGVASALFAVALSSWLEGDVPNRLFDELGRVRSPAQVVASMNKAFQMDDDGLRYFTLTYGIFDSFLWRATVTRAGHTPLAVLSEQGVTFYDEGDPPVGVMANVHFQEQIIALPRNATLLLFSDGVLDQIGPKGERYGQARFEQLLQTLPFDKPRALIDGIKVGLRHWATDRGNSDDISVLALNVSVDRDDPYVREPSTTLHPNVLLRAQIPATLVCASSVAGTLGALAAEVLDEAMSTELRLAAMEALANIIRHGYAGSYSGDEVIDVTVTQRGDQLVLELMDGAPAFDPISAISKLSIDDIEGYDAVNDSPGLGLGLIARSVDDWYYQRRGESNYLRLTKTRLHSPWVGR
jgi:sigma-B regulation protein RsbU (phosphoserine phosphatase)